MNTKVFLLSFLFSVGTFVVYQKYFDILAPFIPGGSVRASYGVFFLVPITLLISAQTLFITWLAYIAVNTAAPGKSDALKAYFVTSVEVFLFSMYYVFFPFYGPYTFVTYFTPSNSFGATAYPILVFWTVATILVTFMLLKRVFGLDNQASFGPVRRLHLAATMLAIMMVTAS